MRSIKFLFCPLLILVAVVILINAQSSPYPSLCTSDFKPGSCYCKLANKSGFAYNYTVLANKTKGNPIEGFLVDSFGKTPYFFSFCVPITNRSALKTCSGKASVCRQDFIDEDLGRPQYTRFELRAAHWVDQATPALVTDNPFDGRTRAVAFLHCNRTVHDVVLTPFEYWGEQDYDGFYLYYMALTGRELCPTLIDEKQTTNGDTGIVF